MASIATARERQTSRAVKPERAELEIIRASNLTHLPDVVHGFSTRRGGFSTVYGGDQLNLGFTASDRRAAVERNRRAFLRGVTGQNRPSVPLITLRQIHSGIVHVIAERGAVPANPLKGDGLITNGANLLLGIQVADCVPVLVFDPQHGAVGAFHAGWRGTAKRIVERGIGTMRALFKCDPKNMQAAIGPCIHACCYAVGDEVIEEFHSQFAYAEELFSEVYDRDPIKEKYPLLFLTARAPGHSNIGPQTHLDLVEANRRQLLDAGLPAENIRAAEECTSCRTDLLFSHRAESGYTGRMMAVIGVRSA